MHPSVRLLRRLLLILGSFTLLACTTVPAPMLPVASFGPLAQSELVSLQAGEQLVAFTARLESDGQTLQVVAITPTGQRLFSLRREGERLHAEPGPLWPQAMPLEAVWADIEIAHAPAEVVLPRHWQRQPDGTAQLWLYRGKSQARVSHEHGKITLQRPAYTLTIEVLPE